MVKKLIPLSLILMLIGCVVMSDPRAELLVAQKSFITVVNSLSDLKEADVFDDNEIDDITKLIDMGDELLGDWTIAALEGKEYPKAIKLFNAILDQLIDYKEKGDRDGL